MGGNNGENKRGKREFWRRGELILIGVASVFEAELQDVIPICHATIAGTRIIGRLTAG